MIDKISFNVSRKGYDPEQVDSFIDLIKDEAGMVYEQMQNQNMAYMELRAKQDEIEEMHSKAKAALEEAEEDAKQRADVIIKEALHQADKLRGQLDWGDAQEVIDKAKELENINHKISRMKKFYAHLRKELDLMFDI